MKWMLHIEIDVDDYDGIRRDDPRHCGHGCRFLTKLETGWRCSAMQGGLGIDKNSAPVRHPLCVQQSGEI